MRPQRFRTWYHELSGTLFVFASTYYVMIRTSDGMTKTFSYEE